VKTSLAAASRALVLGFEPDAVLVREPGLLWNRAFVGALRRELQGELGAREAGATLLQIGFLHGLRDAQGALGAVLEAGRTAAAGPLSPSLALRFRPVPHPGPRGAIELHGIWPERAEAGTGAPACAESPCWVSAGYTSGWLSGVLEADVLALETACRTRGAHECGFVAREARAWRERPEARAHELLDALPFDALRQIVVDDASRRAAPVPRGVDGSEPVVHIWGPVMVLPFAGPDEAMEAVELIGRDPGAAQVSVVVIDLGGAIIDEAFGAAALERIVEAIERWGAEAILAGGSSLSRGVIDGLAHAPVLWIKDLHEAIAAGFRVAEAQRRVL
jgi:hypothetical protein